MKESTVVKTVEAFGWKVCHMQMPQGGHYRYIVTKDTPRDKVPSIYLYTKGKVRCVNLTTGKLASERLPGSLSTDSDAVIEKGRYEWTAIEDSEWWCIPASLNQGKLADVSAVTITQTYTATTNQKLLVCEGTLIVAGKVIQQGESVEVKAGDLVIPHTLVIAYNFNQ